MPKRTISANRFATLVRPLLGLRVSRAWRGHGSVVFLELGKLRKVLSGRNPKGDATIMIEWSWRIETAGGIRSGSWSSERRLSNGISDLQGRRVVAVTVAGRLPEVEVELTGGRWLRSFMTDQGQPAWAVFLTDGTWLCVERSHVVHDHRGRASG